MRLEAEVEKLIAQAEEVDAVEDKLYGATQQPNDLPAELRRREQRRAKIRKVSAPLQKETAYARAAQLSAQSDELRSTAAEPTTTPQQAGARTTRAA